MDDRLPTTAAAQRLLQSAANLEQTLVVRDWYGYTESGGERRVPAAVLARLVVLGRILVLGMVTKSLRRTRRLCRIEKSSRGAGSIQTRPVLPPWFGYVTLAHLWKPDGRRSESYERGRDRDWTNWGLY